jgi:hypothetical protein
VPRPAAQLPDPAVGGRPALGGRVHQLHQEPPVVGVRGLAAPVPGPGQVQQLPVDVVLVLVGGGVADPHRPRAAKAFQVAEDHLLQPPLAPEPVHDLQLLGAAGRAALDEPPEPIGLGGVAELGQRPQREHRVAHPTRPVVPVAGPAGGLREGGGGRGGDRAGSGLGERLEDNGRAQHRRLVRTHQAAPRRPAAPPGHRLGQPAVQLRRGG